MEVTISTASSTGWNWIQPFITMLATLGAVYLGNYLGSKKEERHYRRAEIKMWYEARKRAFFNFARAFLEQTTDPITLWETTSDLGQFIVSFEYRKNDGSWGTWNNLADDLQELCINRSSIDHAEFTERIAMLKKDTTQHIIPTFQKEVLPKDYMFELMYPKPSRWMFWIKPRQKDTQNKRWFAPPLGFATVGSHWWQFWK